MTHDSPAFAKNNLKLAIITVVYQNYDVLINFLDSLGRQTSKNFHIFITDNSPRPQKIDLPGIPSSIFHAPNKGYAAGVNLGLKKAIERGFTQFAVINSDTYVKENFVEKTLSAINNYQSTIIGAKIYYAPGYEYHKARYTETDLGKVIWYAGGIVDWKNVFIRHRGVDEIDRGQFDKFEETEFITGCFMAFDKLAVEKAGFWDEKYFLYFEDADFCERAKRKGIRLYYDPSIVIWHKNAQSTGGSGSKLHEHYQNKNRIRFALKYAPFITKLHILKNLF